MRGMRLLFLLACGCASSPPAPESPIEVEETRDASLFLPRDAASPRPAVVLLHGFSRSRHRLENHGRALAERGFIALVPDGPSLLLPNGRRRNVEAVLGHLDALVRRSATAGDPLHGRVDPGRLGIAGHSAGRAIAVMAAAAAQERGRPVRAIVLLDAVPWDETIEAARTLRHVVVASLRSEPSPSNARGSVGRLVAAFPFAVRDAKVKGASHVDPEDPTDALGRTFAGPVHPECQAIYRRLLVAFLEQELLAAPERPFDRAIEEYVRAGAVVSPP